MVRRWIFEKGHSLSGVVIDRILGPSSSVPIRVSFYLTFFHTAILSLLLLECLLGSFFQI
jgi:hypothetical protein